MKIFKETEVIKALRNNLSEIIKSDLKIYKVNLPFSKIGIKKKIYEERHRF